MSKTGVFYGSSTGNTETAAKQIAELLNADVFDVSSQPTEALTEYNNLIFGSSTWGEGELQDDWEEFITELGGADLQDKVVALFGYGEGSGNPDSFVGAIGVIYNTIKDKGCKVVGQVDPDGYEFDESEAIVNGKFVGLPLDEENQGDLSDERINNWVRQIKPELI